VLTFRPGLEGAAEQRLGLAALLALLDQLEDDVREPFVDVDEHFEPVRQVEAHEHLQLGGLEGVGEGGAQFFEGFLRQWRHGHRPRIREERHWNAWSNAWTSTSPKPRPGVCSPV